MTPKITILGSSNMDLITYAGRLPRRGETCFADSFEMGFGGKGANQAVAAAKLGAEVVMITTVGDDCFGFGMLDNFSKFGIDTSHIQKAAESASGIANIVVDREGHNRILVSMGANSLVTESTVDDARDALRSSDMLLLQLEIPLSTVYYAFSVAQECGVRTMLNPAPATELERRRLQGLSFFVPNQTELGKVVGDELPTTEDIFHRARDLTSSGIEHVVVTLGERGAALFTKESESLFPTLQVDPIDTTGAGDAFIGSLAVFVAEGRPLEAAVKLANWYAALSTLGRGTQKSFLTRAQFATQLTQLGIQPPGLGAWEGDAACKAV